MMRVQNITPQKNETLPVAENGLKFHWWQIVDLHCDQVNRQFGNSPAETLEQEATYLDQSQPSNYWPGKHRPVGSGVHLGGQIGHLTAGSWAAHGTIYKGSRGLEMGNVAVADHALPPGR